MKCANTFVTNEKQDTYLAACRDMSHCGSLRCIYFERDVESFVPFRLTIEGSFKSKNDAYWANYGTVCRKIYWSKKTFEAFLAARRLMFTTSSLGRNEGNSFSCLRFALCFFTSWCFAISFFSFNSTLTLF